MKNGQVLQADKLRSTFWWRMYFKEDSPYYNKKGERLTDMDGYSRLNGPEAMDYRDCLLSSFQRVFWQHGYLKHCKFIEVYKRVESICMKSTDPVFITFYNDRYEIAHRYVSGFNDELRHALNRMYKSYRTGTPPEKGPLIPKVIKSRDTLLDKSGCSSIEEIYEYGATLRDKGLEQGAWTGWVSRELERYYQRKGL